ncbi:MAG: Hsp20/alpha crystallin family protein [Desulfobacteraceae bacterium]|nr:Hsp20/alpha crystallin family protein [Desulfobacteraceae bacterium]
MSELIIWKNQEMNRLRRDMDRLFSRMWSSFGISLLPGEAAGSPSIDLFESQDTLMVKAEFPGINPEDLDISIIGTTLTVCGVKREETVQKSAYHHRVERRFGSFSRSVRLPCRVRVEDIKATYKKGVLQIIMPKLELEDAREVRVKIK